MSHQAEPWGLQISSPLGESLRLQLLAVPWTATRLDQAIPESYTLRRSDFEEDVGWGDFTEPVILDPRLLAFDMLFAGVAQAGEVPVFRAEDHANLRIDPGSWPAAELLSRG